MPDVTSNNLKSYCTDKHLRLPQLRKLLSNSKSNSRSFSLRTSKLYHQALRLLVLDVKSTPINPCHLLTNLFPSLRRHKLIQQTMLHGKRQNKLCLFLIAPSNTRPVLLSYAHNIRILYFSQPRHDITL